MPYYHSSEYIRRGDQALRRADCKAQSHNKNDGQEICERIRDGSDGPEDQSIRPDLPVLARSNPQLEVELGDVGVAAVGVDTHDDAFLLVGIEEAGRPGVGGVREAEKEEEAKACDEASELLHTC